MKRLSNKSPCLECCADRQIGNPYSWQRDCERCEKLENWKASEANRLSAIEDILGEEYDLYKLWELMKIGRCKDCIHYFQSECLKIYDDGACSEYARQERKPDDFCSYFKAIQEG